MPNKAADLKIRNSCLEASQMVVDILKNVNKNHENLNHMAAIVMDFKKCFKKLLDYIWHL